MQRYRTLIIALAGLTLASTGPAWADQNTPRFWRQHQQAQAEILRAWVTDDQAQLQEAVFQLSKAEIYLLAQGAVSPQDSRLVGRLAVDGGRDLRSADDLSTFARALFLQTLQQRTGFEPSLKKLLVNAPFQVRMQSQD